MAVVLEFPRISPKEIKQVNTLSMKDKVFNMSLYMNELRETSKNSDVSVLRLEYFLDHVDIEVDKTQIYTAIGMLSYKSLELFKSRGISLNKMHGDLTPLEYATWLKNRLKESTDKRICLDCINDIIELLEEEM